MSKYQLEQEYSLEIGLVDLNGRPRPSALVEFMQEIATRHASILGLDELAEQNCNAFWVLSRLKFYLNRPPKWHDTVRVKTWPRRIKGALWYRDFRFFVGDEEIGHAVSAWSIISRDKHKLVRPSAMGADVPERIDGIDELLGNLNCDDTQPCFDRTVHYSDIDINRHLNNVKAVDILSDAIGLEDRDDCFVTEMQINYKAETTCGTTLTLSRREDGDTIWLRASAGEQEKLQAKVVLAKA